jgi:hypothetical protein
MLTKVPTAALAANSTAEPDNNTLSIPCATSLVAKISVSVMLALVAEL